MGVMGDASGDTFSLSGVSGLVMVMPKVVFSVVLLAMAVGVAEGCRTRTCFSNGQAAGSQGGWTGGEVVRVAVGARP